MITDEGSCGTSSRSFNVPIESVSSLESHFELGRTIGRGEFAKGLEHPNIIRLLRVLRLPDRLAMVMQYVSGGELFDYVQSSGHLKEEQVCAIMRHILDAVAYLHARNIVHRDLKLENVLRDDGGQVLLSDFGFSAHFEDDKRLETACGSPCYAAPELVLDKSGYIGPPVDLWSCGVIMYAMAFGYLPFESDLKLDRHGSDPVTWTPTNVYHLYQYIVANPVKLPKSSLSDSGRDLLLRLLDADPVMRITLAEALQHPWLAS